MTTPNAPCFPVNREAPSAELLPSTVTVTDHASVPLLNSNSQRRSALIVNTDTTNSVHIVYGRQGSIGDQSFEIPAGGALTVNTAGAVYCVAPPGLTVKVRTLSEVGAI